MNNIKRHTDVVGTMDEFTANYEAGLYTAPWIVYVGNDTEGYSVMYSNDEKRALSESEPEVIDSIVSRIVNLETEKVFCYEEEYDILAAEGKGWITNIDGTRSEVEFDETKLYCIYEDEDNSAGPDDGGDNEN